MDRWRSGGDYQIPNLWVPRTQRELQDGRCAHPSVWGWGHNRCKNETVSLGFNGLQKVVLLRRSEAVKGLFFFNLIVNYDLVEVWRWMFAARRHFSNLLPFPTILSTLIHTSLSLSFLLSPLSLSEHVRIKEDASKYHERRSEFVIIAAVCFVSRTEDLDCRSRKERTLDQGILPWGRKWDRFTETMTILNLRCCLLAADGLFILRQVSDGLRELRCCSDGVVPCVLKTRFTTC